MTTDDEYDCGQDGVCRTPPGCARHWEERCRELLARIAEIEAERDALRASIESIGRALGLDRDADQWATATTAEYEADVVTAAEAAEIAIDALTARVAELEYASSYESDLAAISRVLDVVEAPHDSEDGVSFECKRIRLLADQRDALRERVAELEATLGARLASTRGLAHAGPSGAR